MGTDFVAIANGHEEIPNPYAAYAPDGEWLPGYISVEFLQSNFGQYATASEMQAATDSEGLKLFFGWLADQGQIEL